jgi:indolepyruvate ferredoxin oxidoreductase alpha subunit
VLVLVLRNEIAAMTGGQEAPDLRRVVEAIIPDVSTFDIDVDIDVNIENQISHSKLSELTSKLSELIRTKIALPGISVIFIKGKCRKN